MDTLISFLLFCQIFGALLGVATSLWGELAYLYAMRDGKIDDGERTHLRIIAGGLRWGMTILLVSSLAFIIADFVIHTTAQPALTPAYWTLIAFALLIIAISWALSRRSISFLLGSSALLNAWGMVAYVTLGKLPLSFGSTVALYVVLTAVLYGLLYFIHLFVKKDFVR